MSLLTIAWTTTGAICLTLAFVYGVVWLQKRQSRAHFFFSLARRINYVNPFVCDETGYSSEELLGRGFGELSQRERACTSPIWCTF